MKTLPLKISGELAQINQKVAKRLTNFRLARTPLIMPSRALYY